MQHGVPHNLPGLTALFVGLCFQAECVWDIRGDDWPQWLGPQRDGVWRERGILDNFPAGGPRVRWRTPIGAGYSGPIVADGRVFVMDRPATPAADARAEPAAPAARLAVERVLCLSEATGEQIWQHTYQRAYDIAYPAGPRACPAVAGDRVYTLGAEGDLRCLEVGTGRLAWSVRFREDYGVKTQTWGVAAHPLVDGDRLICLVGGQEHTVVAFDRHSGRELWRALHAKEPGYAAPVIYEAGGARQLIVWDTENLSGLDPATGRVYWSEPFPTQMGHAIGMPRKDGAWLFVTSFFDGSMLMELDPDRPAARVGWRIKGRSETQPEGLHGLMSTPFLEAGHIYGVCGYGQLRCLKTETGERVWETLAPTTRNGKPTRWATAFIVKHGERFLLWNELGDLIIARLSPARYEEIGRAHLLEPTNTTAGRPVVWSHPAFANRCVFVRNDREIVCVELLR